MTDPRPLDLDPTGVRVLGALGDLVEDVTVRLAGPVRRATDTPAVIDRRRGGSAANVAAAAARLDGGAVFIGQVGDDDLGRRLVERLRHDGVRTRGGIGGHTGTVVALVDPDGERSMLSDRGTSSALADPVPAWLDGLHTLHVPWYSLVDGPLADTSRTLIAWARARQIRISIDASSTELIDRIGAAEMLEQLRRLAPDVVLCNRDEAASLGIDRRGAEGPAIRLDGVHTIVVKRGPDPATVSTPEGSVDVEAVVVAGSPDTTGAGDAFAAGFLVALASGSGPEDAVRAGHDAAADHLRTQG